MMTTEPRWRRFAYVAVEDAACRTAIVRALASIDWRVEERSTGFHLIQDLCDIIARTRPSRTGIDRGRGRGTWLFGADDRTRPSRPRRPDSCLGDRELAITTTGTRRGDNSRR